jgi:hypothetical protein
MGQEKWARRNEMDRTPLYRIMTALLWLALPLAAFEYGSVWHRLPARMSTHFAASGQPNGWMSREASLLFALGLTLLLLLVFTGALTRVRKPDTLAWSVLALLYVVMAVMLSVHASVLRQNLDGGPLQVTPAITVVLVAALGVAAVALASKRGSALPGHGEAVEAEEVHSSPQWALALAVLAAFDLAMAAALPLRGLRVALSLPALLLLGVTALAWSGFHYRFTPQGVEISTLGFRLRSIPLLSIRAYAVAPWNPLRGYGIRGLGERRAYVWGNRGVRIMLSQGEVFLGHRDPERIMSDLNLIRQNQKAREHTRSDS